MGVRISGLRDLRRAQGLTQQQLADRAGLSITLISRLEHGHRLASIRVLCQLSTALGVPLATLLAEALDGDRPTEPSDGHAPEAPA